MTIPSDEQLRVVAAAIWFPATIDREALTLSCARPCRHHDVIRAAARLGIELDGSEEQGFLLSDGRFVRRKPAFAVAEQAGQLLRATGPHIGLFSEDVW